MTIKDLIEKLQQAPDKTREVFLFDELSQEYTSNVCVSFDDNNDVALNSGCED